MRLRRLLQACALALLLALGLALVVLAQGGEWLRRIAVERLQAELLPELALGREVEWAVWPQPALVLRELSLRDERGEALLKIDQIALTLHWDDLRARRLRLQTLRLAGVRAVLQRDLDGRWNAAGWLRPRAGPAAEVSAAGLPELRELVLEDLRIELVDAPHGLAAQLTVPHLQLGPLAADAGGELNARATVALQAPRQGTLQAELQTAYVVDVPAGRLSLHDWRSTLEGELSEGEGAGWRLRDGRLAVERLALGTTGELRLAGGALALALDGPALQATLHAALGELEGGAGGWRAAGELDLVSHGFPAARIHSDLRLAAQQLEGSVRGQLQDADLSGRWRWSAEAAPPLEVALSLAYFDADAWQAAAPPSGGGDLPDWAAWPVSGQLDIGTLVLQGARVHGVRLRLDGAPPAR